jgi:myosin protein heavy chain
LYQLPSVVSPLQDRVSLEEEEQAAARAIEEEEALRKRVLTKLDSEGVRFRSGTEDVLEYAVYLGMDLHEDLGLLWIADQALQADDPEGWEQCESPNGDIYYMHEVTKQVLWQHPLDYQYQQLYLTEKKKVAGGSKPGAPAPRRPAAPAEPPAAAAARPAGAKPGDDDAVRRTLQGLLSTSHGDLRTLLTEPAQCKAPVRCFVIRHKSRMGGSKFDFFMSISKSDDMYCFTAKKHSVTKGCYYSIALDQDEVRKPKAGSESFVGKVQSDRLHNAPAHTAPQSSQPRHTQTMAATSSTRTRRPYPHPHTHAKAGSESFVGKVCGTAFQCPPLKQP